MFVLSGLEQCKLGREGAIVESNALCGSSPCAPHLLERLQDAEKPVNDNPHRLYESRNSRGEIVGNDILHDRVP